MRVCLIGLGAISGNHISAVKKAGGEIVGLCDIDRSKAKNQAEKFGITAPVYGDYRKMLDEICPDAVHILTPHYLHAEMAIYALKKGIHVLSEKPICINFEELNALDEAVKNSSARYGICFQNRYLPANVEAKKRANYAKIYSAFGSVLWNRDQKYYESAPWRGRWDTEGGGVLINQSIHTFDLMLNALGKPISIFASMKNEHLTGVIEVEDTMRITVDYGEYNLDFFATTAANESYPVKTEFVTDSGIIATFGDELYENFKKIEQDSSGEIIGKRDWGVGHEMLICDFYECVKANRECLIDYENCRLTMQAVLLAYQSAKSGEKRYF